MPLHSSSESMRALSASCGSVTKSRGSCSIARLMAKLALWFLAQARRAIPLFTSLREQAQH